MTAISFFQRFSQPENHATNNTLLALRYFYEKSPLKLERVLKSLLELEDVSIGLTFAQQLRGSESIPDAQISQAPFRIIIETKRGGHLDADQIRRHFQGISERRFSKGSVYLVGLTKDAIPESTRQAFIEEGKSNGVLFRTITFRQVVEALGNECEDYETDLRAIVDDFENYLAGEGLLEETDTTLAVVACGTSLAENVKYNLYYDPEDRAPLRPSRLLCPYANKAIRYVGRIEAIVIRRPGENGPVYFDVEGLLTDDMRTRIEDVVKATTYYELDLEPTRFYLVDKFQSVEVRKTTAQGVMGRRYLSLKDKSFLANYDSKKQYSTTELIDLLKDATW